MHLRETFLPLSLPSIDGTEIKGVSDVLLSNWLSTGPQAKEFENEFRSYVGADASLALNSCTAGLHLALIAHAVGPGDEVIVSPMTFCATANVVRHVGAEVVLADIDPETLLINPDEVARKITAKTKVIMPVHYAGQPADMEAITEIAEHALLPIVEDAAHCLPSKIGDRMIGHGKNLTSFSFYANKNMTTGEGGMLTGPNELIERLRTLSLHGMTHDAWKRFQKDGSWKYDVTDPGFKYNMNDIQAALGLAQLRKLDGLYERRCEIVRQYNEAFSNLDSVRPLKIRDGVQSSHHLYVVQLNLEVLSIDRYRFITEMTSRHIGTSVHYTPIHMLTYYKKRYGWRPEDFPVTFSCFERIVTLPLSPRMTDQDVADVVEAVTDIAKKFRR